MRCKPISFPSIRGLVPILPRRSISCRPRSGRSQLFTIKPPASYRAFTHSRSTLDSYGPPDSTPSQDAVNQSNLTGAPSLKTPEMKRAYIALGSNMGDRIANIDLACDLIQQMGIKIKRTSSLWETDPMYVTDQDKFLNGVCEVETPLDPTHLLDILQLIEKNMGRVKVVDKGPRIIDLDIVTYDKEIINTERLTVPHALAHEREFVLRPLAELCPGESLDPRKPWKLVADYLEELPPSPMPLTTVTPIAPNLILRGLDPRRKTHIMGIVNMTPDSFSGDGMTGLYWRPHSAMYRRALTHRFEHLIRSGATILDIGGQSTRPNAPYIPGEEEKERVLPAVLVARDLPAVTSGNVAISIDTFSSSVAMAALSRGTHLLNDVSAGTLSGDRMLHLAARKKKTIVLMHMRGTPATMGRLNRYTTPHDPLRNDEKKDNDDEEFQDEDAMIYSIAVELLARVAAAEEAGVRRWHIILDPGLGFAKHGAHQNIALLRRLPELREWPGLVGLPWMVGPSRKSFLTPFVQRGTSELYAGKFQASPNTHQRIYATAAAVAACVEAGADIVRVHDVRAMSETAAVSDAIWRGRMTIAPTYTAPQHDDRMSINDVVEKKEPDLDEGERFKTFMEQVEEDEKKSGYDVRSKAKTEIRDAVAIQAAQQFLSTVKEKSGPDGKPLLPPPSWRAVKRQIMRILPEKEGKVTWQSLRIAYNKIVETAPEFTGKLPAPPLPPTAAEGEPTEDSKTEGIKTEEKREEKPGTTEEEIVRKAMKRPVSWIRRAAQLDPDKLAKSRLLQEQRNNLFALARATKEKDIYRRRTSVSAGNVNANIYRGRLVQATIKANARAKALKEATRELKELDKKSGIINVMTSERLLNALNNSVRRAPIRSEAGKNVRNSSGGTGQLDDILLTRPEWPAGSVCRRMKTAPAVPNVVDLRVLEQTVRQLRTAHRQKWEEKRAKETERERKEKESVRDVEKEAVRSAVRYVDSRKRERELEHDKEDFVPVPPPKEKWQGSKRSADRPGDLRPEDWVERRKNPLPIIGTSVPGVTTSKAESATGEETAGLAGGWEGEKNKMDKIAVAQVEQEEMPIAQDEEKKDVSPTGGDEKVGMQTGMPVVKDEEKNYMSATGEEEKTNKNAGMPIVEGEQNSDSRDEMSTTTGGEQKKGDEMIPATRTEKAGNKDEMPPQKEFENVSGNEEKGLK